MKKIGNLLAAGLLCTAVVACRFAQAAPGRDPAPRVASVCQHQDRTITVLGTGKISLVPDIARVNVGADAMGDTVSKAKTEVEARMTAIVAALEQMGIEEKDIQTSHYTIHYEQEPIPVAREESAPGSRDRYRVSNVLRVIVRDVERAGAVLDAAVEAGANQVRGVTFTVEEENTWQGQVREKAMSDAERRANELASLAGVELGQVVSVSEVIGGWPMGIPSGERGGGMAPGELELSTQVEVVFAVQAAR
jgi:hypothetical protein